MVAQCSVMRWSAVSSCNCRLVAVVAVAGVNVDVVISCNVVARAML